MVRFLIMKACHLTNDKRLISEKMSKDLVSAGNMRVVGTFEEQPPDRTALFIQWQVLSCPVMFGSLNLLGVKGAPFTFLIDLYGIIRCKNPNQDELATFEGTAYDNEGPIAEQELKFTEGSAKNLLM